VPALACVLTFIAVVACKTGPDLSTDYGQTARENYELARGEFVDRDWDETIAYADFVRIRFPFSRYAVEAELLIARAEFAQGNYLTARTASSSSTSCTRRTSTCSTVGAHTWPPSRPT
jgi:outer membrane protein assembly factor BamD